MSNATPVDVKTLNMKPGMGVKLLRDGVDSANFVAIFSMESQKSLNFFANNWSNHYPTPTDQKAFMPLAKRFMTATDYIYSVGLSDMAMIAQDGSFENPIVFPVSLRFEPTGEFSMPDDIYPIKFEDYL